MPNSGITPLAKMKNELKKLVGKSKHGKYLVPSLWVPVGEEPVDGDPAKEVNPGEFFLKHIEAIEKNAIEGIDPLMTLNSQIPGGNGGKWIEKETIFNLFVRLTTAYDHNGDGTLGGNKEDLTQNEFGIRESGTFLKTIALLGYIKSLGATTIHLLPVTAIGHDGNKGELGSPYAIKNPYKLEESQSDPIVDMDVEEQFKALVQACHLLGIRVITEFVFRTASKDSDWIKENPEWFYWIREDVEDRDPDEKDPAIACKHYGNPIFQQQELEVINQKVACGDHSGLPAPSDEFKGFFTLAPNKEDVKFNDKKQFRAEAKCPFSGKMETARIPGAFADWPPDDNQPPWGDVTYLRMYEDENAAQPEFNYIAYNTIRMYDNALAQDDLANKSLWKKLRELVPSYQERYAIDGVMVDMGHAVPVKLMQEIITRAREIDPNFAFLSENFDIKQDSVDAGYNAVVGYAWWVEYRRDGMYSLLNHVGNEGIPLSFFGAVENHNTPRAAERAGGERYAKYAFLVNSMLPGSIPFIHSGQELGETVPVNTGLDFSDEILAGLKGKKLALFDMSAYEWDKKHSLLGFVKKVLKVRAENSEAVMNNDTETFGNLETGHADIICFMRKSGDQNLMVLFNRDLENDLHGRIKVDWCLSPEVSQLENLVADEINPSSLKVNDGHIDALLPAGSCCLFTW
jgi:glycosidase